MNSIFHYTEKCSNLIFLEITKLFNPLLPLPPLSNIYNLVKVWKSFILLYSLSLELISKTMSMPGIISKKKKWKEKKNLNKTPSSTNPISYPGKNVYWPEFMRVFSLLVPFLRARFFSLNMLRRYEWGGVEGGSILSKKSKIKSLQGS